MMDSPNLPLIKPIILMLENKKIMVCAKNSLKGGAIAGAAAFLGGLLLGPAGLAIGATLGGIGGAVATKGKFQSAAEIIKKMPYAEKRKLCESVKNAFRSIGITELILIQSLLLNDNYKEICLREVSKYLESNLNLSFC